LKSLDAGKTHECCQTRRWIKTPRMHCGTYAQYNPPSACRESFPVAGDTRTGSISCNTNKESSAGKGKAWVFLHGGHVFPLIFPSLFPTISFEGQPGGQKGDQVLSCN